MNLQRTIPPVEIRTDGLPRFRTMILVTLALFLTWEVTTRTLVAYLAEVAPDVALKVRSGNATALLGIVEGLLQQASSDGKQSSKAKDPSLGKKAQQASKDQSGFSLYPPGLTPQMEAWIRPRAELALRNDPLNAKAFRILGQLSDRSPDNERTRTLMQGAVERSLHEGMAVYWMMQQSYLKQDYRNAIRYADVLLRTRPQLLIHVMPVFGKIAEARDGSGELKQLLARNPPWRSAFFANFPAAITDARTPLDFLLTLKESPVPPTTAELRSYLNFLVRHKFYELAYYTWLQFLAPEQLGKAGRLFNGNFESEPSGLPFDWNLSRGKGSIVKIAARPGAKGDHALFMQFGPGRVNFRGVRQLLFLPPGNYEFQGTYKVDMISQLGLQWSITCADGQELQIGEREAFNGTDPRWKEFTIPFTVLSECPAQKLRLVAGARSASEKFMSGSAWYDDLRIVRVDAPTAADEASVPQ